MSERWVSAVEPLEHVPATSGYRFESGAVPRAGAEEELQLADFKRYFPHTPTALAIKECARLAAVRRYPCPGPVLDVGCGDGLFARLAFDNVEVWGIDIDAKEGRWAAASRAYAQVILGDVTQAKLPEAFFASCVANCSLEHVPRIDLALRSIQRSLRPGGVAYMFVPNPEWARHLLSVRVLQELGAPGLASELQGAIDRFFVHHHLYDEARWSELCVEAGLEVVAVEPVLSSATTVAFEAFLLPSLLGLLNKNLTTRWTNFPRFRRLFARPVYELVQQVMKRADPSLTAEYLVIARRPA
ncbi:MAG: methyltransferase domain-containing protein [Polyangiaceae bacterium]|nr:methyltransferase domain-containing protein [Polyangiaceae bacterium]